MYEGADGAADGFIGLQGDLIAGLFVREDARGKGIGRSLLDHALKLNKDVCLRLCVYEKNERARRFYARAGFQVCAEGVDAASGERELIMTHSPLFMAETL